MPSPSKEEQVLQLIFENSPMKEWHFDEIVKEAKVTRTVANKWLRKYVKQGIIRRTKRKGKFPIYSPGEKNITYQVQKRIYGLRKLHESGLIEELLKIQNAKTIVIFGSFSNGYWYKRSDVDIFVIGQVNPEDFHESKMKAHKQLDIHIFQDDKELDTIKSGLLINILDGYLVKGTMESFAKKALEQANAIRDLRGVHERWDALLNPKERRTRVNAPEGGRA